jgi:hypothetical protein
VQVHSIYVAIWVKGFHKWSSEFSGAHAPTGCSVAVGSRNIKYKKYDISFILNPMAAEFLETCARI